MDRRSESKNLHGQQEERDVHLEGSVRWHAQSTRKRVGNRLQDPKRGRGSGMGKHTNLPSENTSTTFQWSASATSSSLQRSPILSTAKSFVFFFSFNALFQHSRNFAIEKNKSALSLLLASVRLGVLEAGIFSENTGTNTISGTQIIFIAKQMGAWLIYIRYIVLANFQFSLFGDFSLIYILGEKLRFLIFPISMEKCVFPSQNSPHS